MTMKFNEEFQIGKHKIGYLSSTFKEAFKDSEFVSVLVPAYQKLPRRMSDAAIESELKPGICTLGDLITFMDNAPEECKDGWYNLFYFPSFVVDVDWHGGEWYVDAWGRGDGEWIADFRVFSPATTKPSESSSSASSSLTLESLDARVRKLESLINPALLK